jgi:hypothetical protein
VETILDKNPEPAEYPDQKEQSIDPFDRSHFFAIMHSFDSVFHEI